MIPFVQINYKSIITINSPLNPDDKEKIKCSTDKDVIYIFHIFSKYPQA